jgi:hypothetical protein
MRHNGMRSLLISCLNCRHEKIIDVDHLPGDLTVPSEFLKRLAPAVRAVV